MRRAAAGLLVTALLGVAPAAGFSAAAAAEAPTSLPVIERQVMCVTCKIPLNVAESPQAARERAYIQGLIDQGYGEAGIKRALVGQYGPTVLGLPATHGFDLAAYLVPLGVVIGLVAVLAVTLRRWRMRSGERAGPAATAPLSAADSARLESDMARFD
jgi:cytochrome c-type biogenesis protein CcmH